MPSVLAVVPARGGSKGVPGKNLAPVGGIPLVARAVRACRAAALVTDVVVSTDDPAVAAAARAAGADVVERPAALAGDTATSEAAVLHALDAYEAATGRAVDTVLLVQCTSPFVTAGDVDGVAAPVLRREADCALTVAPFHGFLWREGRHGRDAPEVLTSTGARGVNHDPSHRPRRQDRPQDLLETGAAYAMRADGFRAARHRFFGRVEPVRTEPARVLEVDDPADLARARALAPLLDADAPATHSVPQPAVGALTGTSGGFPDGFPGSDGIDAVVLGSDGTRTGGRVLVDTDGRECAAVRPSHRVPRP